MCASLPKINKPQQSPENDSQPVEAVPPLPWATTNAGQGAGSGIFAIPAGPAPEEIPGFPFPPGSMMGEQGQPVQAPPVPKAPVVVQAPPLPQAPAKRGGSVQPLPGMAIPGGPNTNPQMTQPPQPHPHGGQHAPVNYQLNQAHTNTGRLALSMLNGISTDQLSTGFLDPYDAWFPEPRTIAETGISQGIIADLVLKAMYYTSYMSGQEISAVVRLPFYGIIDQIINVMKKEQLCDVSGASGLGEAGYQYVLTLKGMERASQVLARSGYVGPAPVPLAKYIEIIRLETTGKQPIMRGTVERSLQGMILGDQLIIQVGAAVNAGKSLFLFGAPGNGKTLLAEKIATMLGGSIAIPYALEADGQIIQLFDPNSHRPAGPRGANEHDITKAELHDRRWVRIHRPVVIVGGELTMSSLDLVFNENMGFYEAPFQLKANGGLFLIDDFGRQQMSPQVLLNRWIVPLEKNIDYLTLKTGKKLQVPFELFLVLSTNLQPEDLVDDAFLRRIQNKLHVPDPTAQHFYEIFIAQCQAMGVPFDQKGFAHLVSKHYRETGRPFRGTHPRDLLRQLIGLAKYLNVQPELTPQLLDAACGTYFVNSKK